MPSTVAARAKAAIRRFITVLLRTKAFLASLDTLLDAFIDLGRQTLGYIDYFGPVSNDNNTNDEVFWPLTSTNLQKSFWRPHLTEVSGKKTLWAKSFPLEEWDGCWDAGNEWGVLLTLCRRRRRNGRVLCSKAIVRNGRKKERTDGYRSSVAILTVFTDHCDWRCDFACLCWRMNGRLDGSLYASDSSHLVSIEQRLKVLYTCNSMHHGESAHKPVC